MRTSFELPLGPGRAFDTLVAELGTALADRGLRLEPGEAGRVTQGDLEVGRVTTWRPGERVVLEWRPAPWEPELVTELELAFAPSGEGTMVTVEHRGWEGAVGEDDRAGWFASAVVAPLMSAAAPAGLGDWLTDRVARRPWGAGSRATYRDPLYHWPNFGVILNELALGPEDRLLEVGCGGGALLKRALESGCTAAGIDHSPEMVAVARETNREAIAAGRLEILEGRADHLPFPDASFTCATMTGVLGFLPDPVRGLAEIRRVLRSGGRFVGLGSDPKWRGTPAAPEPMASRIRFYEADELERLTREAGFETVAVVLRDLEPHARAAGVPDEHIPMFAGGGEQFLTARAE